MVYLQRGGRALTAGGTGGESAHNLLGEDNVGETCEVGDWTKYYCSCQSRLLSYLSVANRIGARQRRCCYLDALGADTPHSPDPPPKKNTIRGLHRVPGQEPRCDEQGDRLRVRRARQEVEEDMREGVVKVCRQGVRGVCRAALAGYMKIFRRAVGC